MSEQDVAVQTNCFKEGHVSRASQTQSLPKPRRSRCTGRAVQTDIIVTSRMGVQTCPGMASVPLQTLSASTSSEESDAEPNTSDDAPAALNTNMGDCTQDRNARHEGSLIMLSLKGHISKGSRVQSLQGGTVGLKGFGGQHFETNPYSFSPEFSP